MPIQGNDNWLGEFGSNEEQNPEDTINSTFRGALSKFGIKSKTVGNLN